LSGNRIRKTFSSGVLQMTTLARAALTMLLATSSAHASDKIVQIVVPNDQHAPVQACADALMSSRSALPDAKDATFEVKTWDAAKDDPREPVRIVIDTDSSKLALPGIPFVFRDAQHFQAYLTSDLFQSMRGRLPGDVVAIAYGGFYQLFSRIAASTEPKHLYGRTIGGDARAMMVYHEFGARAGQGAMASIVDMVDLDTDFRWMREGHIWGQIVEAPLAQAADNAVRSARYVSLISSVVQPIYIKADEEYRAWAQDAAIACSATNYDAELKVLDRLKQAGLTIVPFNRNALVETGWRIAVTMDHPYWTIAEFDRVVQLAGGTKGVPLPSEIVAKLPPKQRREALKLDQVAIKETR
jgi:hypothetical protein